MHGDGTTRVELRMGTGEGTTGGRAGDGDGTARVERRVGTEQHSGEGTTQGRVKD